MTRINCVPVSELTDKHLLAEYRELPRISALAHKYYEREIVGATYKADTFGVFNVGVYPVKYTLGKGHVRFFYNKGEFLRKRFEEQIVPEMQRRGFRTTYTNYRLHPIGMNCDWEPSDEALTINRGRINERLLKR
jgi:hypothetical protein